MIIQPKSLNDMISDLVRNADRVLDALYELKLPLRTDDPKSYQMLINHLQQSDLLNKADDAVLTALSDVIRAERDCEKDGFRSSLVGTTCIGDEEFDRYEPVQAYTPRGDALNRALHATESLISLRYEIDVRMRSEALLRRLSESTPN